MLLHVLNLSVKKRFHSGPEPFIVSNFLEFYIAKVISLSFLENVHSNITLLFIVWPVPVCAIFSTPWNYNKLDLVITSLRSFFVINLLWLERIFFSSKEHTNIKCLWKCHKNFKRITNIFEIFRKIFLKWFFVKGFIASIVNKLRLSFGVCRF